MEIQFHVEGKPRSEALRLPDLGDSHHTVPTPDSPTGHGGFMHYQVTRKNRHRNITVLQGYNHNGLEIERLCQAFYEEHIEFGCLQEN
eukprot:11015973-Ditylum_brightwellii.AAC.1